MPASPWVVRCADRSCRGLAQLCCLAYWGGRRLCAEPVGRKAEVDPAFGARVDDDPSWHDGDDVREVAAVRWLELLGGREGVPSGYR